LGIGLSPHLGAGGTGGSAFSVRFGLSGFGASGWDRSSLTTRGSSLGSPGAFSNRSLASACLSHEHDYQHDQNEQQKQTHNGPLSRVRDAVEAAAVNASACGSSYAPLTSQLLDVTRSLGSVPAARFTSPVAGHVHFQFGEIDPL
jgi:hypothetical protein